uniref:Uncharacterized protein n=1 Tax=Setaria viridis TaxID=4556 RepID=A0A4U6VTG6_SETVI|nr:hypothetical protein SEVIR_3G298333v2 [Setaria viridis]
MYTEAHRGQNLHRPLILAAWSGNLKTRVLRLIWNFMKLNIQYSTIILYLAELYFSQFPRGWCVLALGCSQCLGGLVNWLLLSSS